MKIVQIKCSAQGHYSGAYYEEVRYLKAESYEKVKDKIKNLDLYIGELDGKHSETKADIEITYYDNTKGVKESMSGNTNEYFIEAELNSFCAPVGVAVFAEEAEILKDEEVNFPKEEKVTITKREYERLLEAEKQLDHLESMGVDNWSEYSHYSSEEEEDEGFNKFR